MGWEMVCYASLDTKPGKVEGCYGNQSMVEVVNEDLEIRPS